MPELPDLQVFSRNLDKRFSGKGLKRIKLVNSKRLKVSGAALNKQLAGSTLTKIYREGKQLRFAFDNGAVLGMHLMLHGKLVLFEKSNSEKNTIAEFLFD